MFNRELPQPGEIWTHYKKKEKNYYIIGQGFHLSEKARPYGIIYTESWINVIKELAINYYFIVRHTEKNLLYKVKLVEDKWILYIIPQESLDHGYDPYIVAWLRPIDNFMEVLNNFNDSEIPNFHRFEKKK